MKVITYVNAPIELDLSDIGSLIEDVRSNPKCDTNFVEINEVPFLVLYVGTWNEDEAINQINKYRGV